MTKNKISNIIGFIIISLIPLWIYGFYKNGIFLYIKDLISFIEMLKPLIFPLLGFLLGYLINYLFKNKKVINPFYPLYGFILGMIVSINIPYWLFLIVCLGFLIVFKLIPKNRINLVCIIFIVI